MRTIEHVYDPRAQTKARLRSAAAVAISLALIVPVLFLPAVSGDRPSHVYNAWLAQLVARGEAPGLRIVPMTTNILYDSLLAALAHLVSFVAAEKIATSLFVLLFFWSMFALVQSWAGSEETIPGTTLYVAPPGDPGAIRDAASDVASPGKRSSIRDVTINASPSAHPAVIRDIASPVSADAAPPHATQSTSVAKSQPESPFPALRATAWSIIPLLAMLCYGWTFSAGFMNFYGSIALANIAIARWSSAGRSWRLLLLLGIAAWLAHPLGVVWMIGAITWREFSERTSWPWSIAGVAVVVAALVALRVALTHRYTVIDWPEPRWVRTGIDQFWLYGDGYRYVAMGAVAFVFLWIALDIPRWRDGVELHRALVPLGLWAMLLAAAWILPNGIKLPAYAAPFNYVVSRATVLLVLTLACLCAGSRARWWKPALLAVFAAAFLWMNFSDVARLGGMERQAEQFVRRAPPRVRVVALLFWPDSRVIMYHLPDLACTGRCFSYADYEPSSGQFRIRATGANRASLWTPDQIVAVETGHFIPQPQDQPIYQLYQCRAIDNLCFEQLKTGEMNGMQVVRNGWLAHQRLSP